MQRHIWDISEVQSLAFALALGMTLEQRQGMARLLLAIGLDVVTVCQTCRLTEMGDSPRETNVSVL